MATKPPTRTYPYHIPSFYQRRSRLNHVEEIRPRSLGLARPSKYIPGAPKSWHQGAPAIEISKKKWKMLRTCLVNAGKMMDNYRNMVENDAKMGKYGMGKCWEHAGKCWENAGKMLAKWWENDGEMLHGTMMGKCWENVGNMLGKSWKIIRTWWKNEETQVERLYFEALLYS